MTAGGGYQPRTFDEAYSHLFRPLCRFVRGRADALHERVRLPAGAENLVVQRVFDAAFATGWENIRQPRTWLYAVAGHQLLLLAGGRRTPLAARPAQGVTWTSATMTGTTEIGFAAIVAGHAVCELPDHRSQVSYLNLCERWSFREIADALGISETAARAQADDARDLLQHATRRTCGPSRAVTLLVGAQAHPAEPIFAVHVERRAHPDAFSVLVVLLAGVLTAAGGLLLGSVWRSVLLVAGAVLVLFGTILGWQCLRAGSRRRHSAASPGPAARVLLLAIAFHRAVLARLLPASCRFTPSCSAYAQEALHRYGVLRGSVLAARRLARCRPFGPRGHDPVPRRRRPISL